MEKSFLVIILFFTSIAAATTREASAAAIGGGFFYTRTRGTCTPQYWSGRRESWPRMVPETSTVSKVFGSRAYERYRMDLTLLESTARNDDDNAFGALLKQGTAALLNAYARKGFPYTAWEVKTMVIQALVSEKAAAKLAKKFSIANEACNKLYY